MSDRSFFKRIKMENIRSPFENIFNIIGGLPQGHEKPLKHALYNAVALLLLCLCCAVAWALYLILEPFIKPLMWALLVGSVLHPLKSNLASKFKSWFDQLQNTSKPVFIGIMMLPVDIINDTSEFIGGKLLKHIKIIIGFAVAIPVLHIMYNYTPCFCISILWSILNLTNTTITWLISIHSTVLMSAVLLGYISVLTLRWRPATASHYHGASLAMWILISCYIAHFAGSYSILIFTLLQILFMAGFIVEVIEVHDTMKDKGKHISFIKSMIWVIINHKVTDDQTILKTIKEPLSDTVVEKKENDKESTTEPKSKNEQSKNIWKLELFDDDEKTRKIDSDTITEADKVTEIEQIVSKSTEVEKKVQTIRPTTVVSGPTRRHTINTSLPGYTDIPKSFLESYVLSRLHKKENSMQDEDSLASDFYLYYVFCACGVMLLWKNIVLLPFLPIPILIYVTKHTGNYLGVWNCLEEHWNVIRSKVYEWCKTRQDALIPTPIRGLYKIICKLNKTIESGLRDSIDTVSSVVVIFGLIVFLTCASIFICIQIYAECIMLVQVGSNVINSTVVHNPELRQLLPPGWDDTMDSLLDNAYTYGREGISKAVRGMMTNVEDAKAAKLEQQVLELWDRVYQSWVSSNTEDVGSIGPKVTASAVQHSWNAFLDDIQKSPEMFNINGLIDFLKQNVGTLMSLLESVWSILKGNISLVLGSFSAFVSVLLGGGTAVLNFILNVVVFLTTLFYLLSASGDLYKPVELLSSVSPSNGGRFGLALEQAINGVFKASGKMAAFYGMWTWLMHNLFGVKIVYLPTALATILGAVPFLGTYWACFPAALDLWLAQGETALAVLLVVCQFAPCAFIDATIYQEIKGGGHPYLTGLAIAGGIFWLGMEGAIIGPLLLCGLFVAVDLSSTLFRETPSEENALPLRLQRLGFNTEQDG